MNQERIKLLTKVNKRMEDFYATGPAQRAAVEDFAYVLIQHCIAQLEMIAFRNFDCEEAVQTCDIAMSAIKTHFGIKS